jgi:hypothetical protein
MTKAGKIALPALDLGFRSSLVKPQLIIAMQLPERNFKIKTQICHLLKVFFGIDTGFI